MEWKVTERNSEIKKKRKSEKYFYGFYEKRGRFSECFCAGFVGRLDVARSERVQLNRSISEMRIETEDGRRGGGNNNEERKKEKLGLSESSDHEIMEIDLDEDGPLREEYIPRRRTSVRDTSRDNQTEIILPSLLQHCDWQMRERSLPPPAKWSPAADEPIRRDDHRVQGQYVAVQPSMAPPPAPMLAPVAPYLPSVMHVSGYAPQPQHVWDPMYPAPPRVQLPPIYPQYSQGYDNGSNGAPAQAIQPHSHVHNHTRSSSSYLDNYAPGHGQQHNRSLSQSYSQSQFGHPYSDARMTTQKLPTPPELHWHAMDRYGYGHAYGRLFGPEPMAPYQPTWIRA